MGFRKMNNIVGWLVWLIASYVYLSTIEPTVSFWDCGEFIASAVKLEVGHPPGAPFFMFLGRLFSLFVEKTSAAMMINAMSALCSSFTILFLFWTITHLARKLLRVTDTLSQGQTLAIIGSGLIGALAYTFSDTFWFSAVEGEVYAMSSLFTAIVFWAILKWENVADQPFANKWIIFIAYMMGLSIGVHLLNLLCIPAIVFVYYFRKYEVTTKGVIWATLVAVAILGVVQGGIIPQTFNIASKFELLFVNGFGMPFNSGMFFYVLLILVLFVIGILWTRRNGRYVANTALWGTAMVLIGYSSFAMIMIRSNANPPMDENNPEHAFSILSYLNREQYGDRPLLYGQYFNTPLDNRDPYKDGNPVYFKDVESGKYIVSDDKEKSVPNYADEFCSIFPRMYSSEGKHVREYKKWTDFKGKKGRYRSVSSGEMETIYMPTFSENMDFFFTYQIGWMYFRYFMWNFAGRQNDIQGHGNALDGNWISGVNFIDEARLGPQDNLPETITANKARNRFYFLPLILGILGLVFQFSRSKKDTLVVFLLFFFTGIAIVIYLNQYPLQPRERDYAYVGSFYAFAIWIGLGVLFLYDMFKNKLKEAPSAVATTLVCLIVPGIMAKDGWDDHDRSNTFTARDFAMNYLNSCEKDAVLFTNGDNDTFPLWYVQEVEEYRTDVRVCNLSLLNTDWYINQQRRKAYDGDAVPFGMPEEKYRQGTRDYVPVYDKFEGKNIHIDVKEAIDFVTDDSKMLNLRDGRRIPYFPARKFSLSVDKEKLISQGAINLEQIKEDSAKMVRSRYISPLMAPQYVDEIKWDVSKGYIFKNDMMILDLLANFEWDRPIYFAITTGNSAYIGLEEHFQLEGLTYRLLPIKTLNRDPQTKQQIETGYVNTDIMYDNLMNKFKWGGMETHEIYLNENNRRMCMNLRNNFSRLAEALIAKGEKEKALEVLDRCMEVMPEKNVPFDFFMVPVIEAYYKAGNAEKANELTKKVFDLYEEEFNYLMRFDGSKYASVKSQAQQDISILYRVFDTINRNKQEELKKELEPRFMQMQTVYQQKG